MPVIPRAFKPPLPAMRLNAPDRRVVRLVVLRLFAVAVTVLFVITLLFFLLHAAPGDAINYRYGSGSSFTADQLEAFRAQLGLDEPILVQYGIYVRDLVQGDLGQSSRFNDSVLNVVFDALPETFILMVPALIIGIVAGTLLGIYSARKPNSARDNGLRLISLVGYSTPEFWVAIMLIFLFSVRLEIFPVGGFVDPRLDSGTLAYYWSVAKHAVLPVFSLSLISMATYARFSRTSILEQSTENYVLTARAKGLGERRTFNRHVLRNSLLPMVTLVGISLTYLLGGAVLVETVFAWPGIGRLMFDALLARDYPLVQGIFFITAMLVIAINLLVDVVYGFADPRVRRGT